MRHLRSFFCQAVFAVAYLLCSVGAGAQEPQTQLPRVTAAFVADDGTIVNLADMQPQSTDSHCSARPVRFVLEMHQGWFAKRGLKAGMRLSGPAFQK